MLSEKELNALKAFAILSGEANIGDEYSYIKTPLWVCKKITSDFWFNKTPCLCPDCRKYYYFFHTKKEVQDYVKSIT